MSLARVELRSFDPSQVRFRGSVDLERLSAPGLGWPKRDHGYRIADEQDAADQLEDAKRDAAQGRRKRKDDPKRRDALASMREVESMYRALRKGYEDRRDKLSADRWYFSEMEVGRRYSDRRLTRWVRQFYRRTSGYGLSPLRAITSFVAVAAVAFLLLMIPSSEICLVNGLSDCAGWRATTKAVLFAVSLQNVPAGLRVSGVASTVVWLLARFGGAAMLVSAAVAFRNQIAR